MTKPRETAQLGVSAAARRAGLAEHTIRRLADEGKVEHKRDSANRRLFTAADIDKYVNQNR